MKRPTLLAADVAFSWYCRIRAWWLVWKLCLSLASEACVHDGADPLCLACHLSALGLP